MTPINTSSKWKLINIYIWVGACVRVVCWKSLATANGTCTHRHTDEKKCYYELRPWTHVTMTEKNPHIVYDIYLLLRLHIDSFVILVLCVCVCMKAWEKNLNQDKLFLSLSLSPSFVHFSVYTEWWCAFQGFNQCEMCVYCLYKIYYTLYRNDYVSRLFSSIHAQSATAPLYI